MKLLKFPLLVQGHILKSMDYSQLFFLSLSSNKTKVLITYFKYNLLGFFFRFRHDALRVYFQDKDKKQLLLFKVFSFDVGTVSSEILEFVEEENTPACTMKFHRKSEDSDVVLDIQKHIFETFSNYSKLYFTVVIDDIDYYRYVPGVERFNLMEKRYKVEVVEELIRNHSELKAVIIFNDLVGDISPDSNIFDVRNLTIQYPSRPLADFMEYYRGRFAVFCTPQREEAQLFLDRWLRKDCSENIKHVIIYILPEEEQFDDRLFVNFGKKRWDTSVMPKTYPFDKDDAYYSGTNSRWFTCNGLYYSERFDGKVATVGINANYLLFSVWDQRPW
ncbi:unnamed protein product [Caenorhabditis brenneri]